MSTTLESPVEHKPELESQLLHRRADANWMVNKTLAECNQHLFRTKVAADVTFSIEYKDGPSKDKPIKIHAHKMILLARSPVFNVMFCGELPETKPEIVIDDVEPEAFEELLRYIYYDEANITSDNVLYVTYASKKYIMPAVTAKCSRFLQEQLTHSNVCSILEHSLFFNDEPLVQRALQVIQSNAVDVLDGEGFVTLTPNALEKVLTLDTMAAEEVDVFAACMAWATAECERKELEPTNDNQRKVLGEQLYNIRFTAMTLQQFADIVVPSGILNSEEGYLLFQVMVCQSKPDLKQLPFKAEPRSVPYHRPTPLLLPGPYPSKSIGVKHQETYQLLCLVSKDIKLSQLFLHDFTRDGYDYSKFEVILIQHAVPTTVTYTNEDKDGVVTAIGSQTVMMIPMKNALVKQGKFKLTINHWVQPLQASFTFSSRLHNISFGENETGYVVSDKHLTFKVARVAEMPLLGIEYVLA